MHFPPACLSQVVQYISLARPNSETAVEDTFTTSGGGVYEYYVGDGERACWHAESDEKEPRLFFIPFPPPPHTYVL